MLPCYIILGTSKQLSVASTSRPTVSIVFQIESLTDVSIHYISEIHSLVSVVMSPFADLENWNGTDRHHFNAIVADQDLVEVKYNVHYLPLMPDHCACCDLPANKPLCCRPIFQHLKRV